MGMYGVFTESQLFYNLTKTLIGIKYDNEKYWALDRID